MHAVKRLLAPSAVTALVACNSGSGKSGPFHPDASCPVTIDNPAIPAAQHLPEGTAIDYATNPPAGGPHYPVWATWGVHMNPVPRPYYVHNLEHGGVVLLYKCTDSAMCASAEAFLKSVMDAVQTDSTCQPPVRVRVVITRDDAIPTPFAASAWGWTYVSDCPDMPSLLDFVRTHYAHGPEDLCADGLFGP
jgi:hypothetical protein